MIMYVVIKQTETKLEYSENYPCTRELVPLTEPRIIRIVGAIRIYKVYENYKTEILKGEY